MDTLIHWVFAYGSLLWNPGFVFEQVRPARVDGWSRRFWQGSTDHRGTPEYPGLVCTLVPEPEEHCMGVAYAVREELWPETRAMLDFREKDGYQLRRLPAMIEDAGQDVWVYVADQGNPSYHGQRSLQDLAARIARARGESGPNTEYLLRLQEALQLQGIVDPHVAELVTAVLEVAPRVR